MKRPTQRLVDVNGVTRRVGWLSWGPGPISAGTAGEAAVRGGSIAVVGMAANPSGAHQAGEVSLANSTPLVERCLGRAK